MEIMSSCQSQQQNWAIKNDFLVKNHPIRLFLNLWASSLAGSLSHFFIIDVCLCFHVFFLVFSNPFILWSLLSYIMLYFLLSGQWLTPLWQSSGTWCQILYVRWLLQGVHHPPDQQLRLRAGARAGAGAELRGMRTDTYTARLQTPSGLEDDWWWWWWWWCSQHWGTSQHFRVWVSVCVWERDREYMGDAWEHHQIQSDHKNRKVWLQI